MSTGPVVGHYLDYQPGGVGWEASRGDMIESHAVLEVTDGVFNLGVAAMVGLQFRHLSVPVGDEAVLPGGGEKGQLRARRGLNPTDDEPHRRGIRFATERCILSLRQVAAAPSIQ